MQLQGPSPVALHALVAEERAAAPAHLDAAFASALALAGVAAPAAAARAAPAGTVASTRAS